MASNINERDWSNLPAPALCLVLDKLPNRIDRIWVSAVCKDWLSVSKDHHSKPLPMLLIPTRTDRTRTRNLYGIAAQTVYKCRLNLPKKTFCGSSHGWLATADRHGSITLYNPFTNAASINLPRIKIECDSIKKVILSADPSTSPREFSVAVITEPYCTLAHIKAGQKSWIPFELGDHPCFTDVIFHKGLVFVVGRTEDIVGFDFETSGEGIGEVTFLDTRLPDAERRRINWQHTYLVESLEGELLMVKRFLRYDDRATKFTVHKVLLGSQGKMEMCEVQSLGDNVLFLGSSSDSMSISALDFPFLEKESIYFIDDLLDPYPPSSFDMGIYNLKDGRFTQHCPLDPSIRRMLPAHWILPPLNPRESQQ